MAKSSAFLSKTKYLNGLQCPKLLWYQYNRKDEIPPFDPVIQFTFDEGHRVGELAQKLFPDGIKIERSFNPLEQAARSLSALKSRRPLFEAGFICRGAYALADILIPADSDAWDLIEVKSSTKIKEENYHDAAFQRYVYQGAGLKIRRCFIMYVNNQYQRRGAVEPEKLLIREDVTPQTGVLSEKIEKAVELMLKVVGDENAPGTKVGPHCGSPRACPLKELCWEAFPESNDIFILYQGGGRCFELAEKGILKIADIPEDFKLNYRQTIQVDSHRTAKPHIDRDSIRAFLEKIEYPLCLLDFETLATAIPLYDNCRPYQNIPFQYSLHKIEKTGEEPVHFSYLASGEVDPRPEILAQLKEKLGEKGSIVVYNASFEKACLKFAAEAYPDFSPWVAELEGRFVDLLEPFQKFYYYHPRQKGSASLKDVLPALTGQSYAGLEIADGGCAAAEYYRVTFGAGKNDREKVRAYLEKYCGLDTEGMVKILAALKASTSAPATTAPA